NDADPTRRRGVGSRSELKHLHGGAPALVACHARLVFTSYQMHRTPRWLGKALHQRRTAQPRLFRQVELSQSRVHAQDLRPTRRGLSKATPQLVVGGFLAQRGQAAPVLTQLPEPAQPPEIVVRGKRERRLGVVRNDVIYRTVF